MSKYLLNSGTVYTRDNFSSLDKQRKEIVEKWSKLGLLDGITGQSVAELLMSEAAVLIQEEMNKEELAGIATSIKLRGSQIIKKYCQ